MTKQKITYIKDNELYIYLIKLELQNDKEAESYKSAYAYTEAERALLKQGHFINFIIQHKNGVYKVGIQAAHAKPGRPPIVSEKLKEQR